MFTTNRFYRNLFTDDQLRVIARPGVMLELQEITFVKFTIYNALLRVGKEEGTWDLVPSAGN